MPDKSPPEAAKEEGRTPEEIEAARKLFAGPCDFVSGAASIESLPGISLPEVAFAGRSNVGKSSMINLIAKFYQPDKGFVLIDGFDTRSIKADSLHRQMGIVSQHNFLFSGTVMDNIRFGRPAAADEEIVAIVRRLDFLDVIGSLSSGFATTVTKRPPGFRFW